MTPRARSGTWRAASPRVVAATGNESPKHPAISGKDLPLVAIRAVPDRGAARFCGAGTVVA